MPKSGLKSFVPSIGDVGQWDHTFDSAAFLSSLVSRPKGFRALARRPKGVAWIVSHCNSQSGREKYVNELSKHIEVDIFGSCGNLACSPLNTPNPQSCSDHVNQNYMFYIAFENTFCDQYVTEKLWFWLSMDIVPVVMGQANYADITPPHSIINVVNFPEPKHLAAYLKQLMDNEAEYLSYFWWKDYYEVNTNTYVIPIVSTWSYKLAMQPSYCKLCEMLNNPEQPPKIQKDLTSWWLTGCTAKGLQPWSKYRGLIEERFSNDIILSTYFLFILIILFIKLKRHHRLIRVVRLVKLPIAFFGLMTVWIILARASLGLSINVKYLMNFLNLFKLAH